MAIVNLGISCNNDLCNGDHKFSVAQLKFAHGKGVNRGRHGRILPDKGGRLGRGRKFRPVISTEWIQLTSTDISVV